MVSSPKTLQEAIQFFSDYDNCRQFLASVRWLDGQVRCPYCGSEQVTYLAKARVYRCYGKHPKQKFSLKVATVFEDSPLALEKWLPAVWMVVNCKNGISSFGCRAYMRLLLSHLLGMVFSMSFEAWITIMLAAITILIGLLGLMLTVLAIGIGVAAFWGYAGVIEAAANLKRTW